MGYIFVIILTVLLVNIVSKIDNSKALYFPRFALLILGISAVTLMNGQTSIIGSSVLSVFLMFYLMFYKKVRIKNKERLTEEIIYAVFIPLTLWGIVWLCIYIKNLIREGFEINILLAYIFIFIPPIISGYMLGIIYRSARAINTLLTLGTSIAVGMTIFDITTDTMIDVRYVIYGISISCFLLCISSIYSYVSNKGMQE